jgi:ribosomal protein L37AE/L43A
MQLSTYELKYCERCGSLRLRRAASAGTYCEPCGQMLANYSLCNHAQRASLLLRKPRPKSGAALMAPGDSQSALSFGRLQ